MRVDDERAGCRRARWVLVVASLSAGAGCLQFDRFRCQGDEDCVFEGQPGQCRLAEQVCIYPDSSCSTQWSAAGGECMEAQGNSGTSTDTGASESGEVGPCGPDTSPIAMQGMVWASTVFQDNDGIQYPASLAVDGDYGTSWLSAGNDLSGTPSFFEWTLPEPRCFARIAVIGNGDHDEFEYRENYGFGGMIIRVYDEDEVIVFQRMFTLPDSPDPDAIAEPGVEGVKIELELLDHEVFFSGGFSELEIDAS